MSTRHINVFSMHKNIYFHTQALRILLQKEKLVARREFDNRFDKFAVKVLNGEETVGHLPREYSRIAWYFLARGGSISVEVSGDRRHCKQLCGGMEIPCRVKFTCSRKAMLNRLKDLLTKKV